MNIKTNSLTIIVVIILILGGISGFYIFEKNKGYEKQQECARGAARYLEKQNQEYSESNSSNNFFTSNIKNVNYYKGFCYLEYETYHNAKYLYSTIINVDSEEIIATYPFGSSDYFKRQVELFKNLNVSKTLPTP